MLLGFILFGLDILSGANPCENSEHILKKLVDAMAPEMIIPIHSFHPDKFKDYFPNVRLVDDGEVVNL